MTDKQEQFKKLYKEIILEKGQPMTKELLELQEDILVNELNDNPSLMDELIESILSENGPPEISIDDLVKENEELKARLEMSEGAILDLAEMLVTR